MRDSLVEVQFQPDEDLYYRLFYELFFLKQYKLRSPWQFALASRYLLAARGK